MQGMGGAGAGPAMGQPAFNSAAFSGGPQPYQGLYGQMPMQGGFQSASPGGLHFSGPSDVYNQLPDWAKSYLEAFRPSESASALAFDTRTIGQITDLLNNRGSDFTPFAYQGIAQGGLGLDPSKFDVFKMNRGAFGTANQDRLITGATPGGWNPGNLGIEAKNWMSMQSNPGAYPWMNRKV